MKKTGLCPKCGSSNIIANAKAIDRGDGNSQHEMIVATFRNPSALLLKGKQTSKVSAWVCVECGFTEFYTKRPYDLVLP